MGKAAGPPGPKQLPVNDLEKAADDGPQAWVQATQVADVDQVPDSGRALPWPFQSSGE